MRCLFVECASEHSPQVLLSSGWVGKHENMRILLENPRNAGAATPASERGGSSCHCRSVAARFAFGLYKRQSNEVRIFALELEDGSSFPVSFGSGHAFDLRSKFVVHGRSPGWRLHDR